MPIFKFFLEWDGKKTLTNPYEYPADTIYAGGAASAVNAFAAKNKLKNIGYDSLEHEGYRGFFEKKNFFGKSRELIYFISCEEERGR